MSSGQLQFLTEVSLNPSTTSLFWRVTAKALPCLHTFCEGCLRDYIVSRLYESTRQFPCPICRNETSMPDIGVQGFPNNHLVASLSHTVETTKRAPPIPPRPQFNANTDKPFERLYPELPPAYTPPLTDVGANRTIACSLGLLKYFGKYGPGLVDFLKPIGLAVSRDGHIIVTDHGGYRILIFSNDGHLKTKFPCNCVINDVTITSKNTILVSVNSKSAIMRHYLMDGRLIGEYGTFYQYADPVGITTLSSGHVMISDLQSKCVYIFTEQYKFSDKFGRKGSGDEHFLTPNFITSNSKDNIIVSDSDNHNIQVFSNTGKFKFRFGSAGTSHGQLLNPRGICSDQENNIIVADSGNSRVQMFTPKGKYLGCVVENTFEIGPDVKPVHVATTPHNDVVVLLTGSQFAEVRIYQSVERSKFHC